MGLVFQLFTTKQSTAQIKNSEEDDYLSDRINQFQFKWEWWNIPKAIPLAWLKHH